MLDPMDVIGPMADRLLALARELEAMTPPGQPIDTDSPQYKQLFAAMEESKAALQKTEAELDRQIAAELAELQKDLGKQQAEQAKERPVPAAPHEVELAEGHRVFAFEKAHAPAAAELDEAIQRLSRRRLPASPAGPPETELGSIWGNLPTSSAPVASQPPPVAPPLAAPPPQAADEGLGSLWSRWIVEPSPPPKKQREDDDWEKSSQIEGL